MALWVIYALLDPDPDSGSTDPIESRSATLELTEWIDVLGVEEELDYLVETGVNTILLSSFFKSPGQASP